MEWLTQQIVDLEHQKRKTDKKLRDLYKSTIFCPSCKEYFFLTECKDSYARESAADGNNYLITYKICPLCGARLAFIKSPCVTRDWKW